jgi:hypothetical protein
MAQVPKFCPNCGAPQTPGAMFCGKCGTPLAGAQAGSPPQMPFTYPAETNGKGGGAAYWIAGASAAAVILLIGAAGWWFVIRPGGEGTTPTALAQLTATVAPATQIALAPTAVPTATTPPTNTSVPPTATAVPPTSTPTPVPPTATPAPPTATPRPPTATSVPTSQAGAALYTQEFKNGLGTFSEAENDTVKTYLKDGTLRKLMKVKDWHGWSRLPNSYSNFIAEAVILTTAGGENSGGGLTFRETIKDGESSYYRCQITSAGEYYCDRRDGAAEKKVVDIVKYTVHPAIKKGENQKNTLRMVAKGAQITMYANGVQMVSFTDDTLTDGRMGLSASGFYNPGVEVAFESVRVWEVK